MFKSGDLVYGIDRYRSDSYLTYGMIIGDVGDYYILYEQIDKDIAKNTTIERIYEEHVKNGETNVVILGKENTFATEQEAREVLDVIG